MFFVFNKDKITAYVVTVFTVIVLFMAASFFKNTEESVPTSVNEIKTNIINNNILENNVIENNDVEQKLNNC